MTLFCFSSHLEISCFHFKRLVCTVVVIVFYLLSPLIFILLLFLLLLSLYYQWECNSRMGLMFATAVVQHSVAEESKVIVKKLLLLPIKLPSKHSCILPKIIASINLSHGEKILIWSRLWLLQ